MKVLATHRVTLEFMDEIEVDDLGAISQFYESNPLELNSKCFVGARVLNHQLRGAELTEEKSDENPLGIVRE